MPVILWGRLSVQCPFHGFAPAIDLGIISLSFLALVIFAPYQEGRDLSATGTATAAVL
jgi:hypothetical protein